MPYHMFYDVSNDEPYKAPKPESKKEKDPEPLAQGYLGMVKNLNLAVTTTEQELGLLLEIESTPTERKDTQVLLNQFFEKFSELPHYKHDTEATRAYVSSLLQSNKDGDSVLFGKMQDLQKSLALYKKDLQILDAKYIVNKANPETVEETTQEPHKEVTV